MAQIGGIQSRFAVDEHKKPGGMLGGIQISHRSKEEIESLARFAVDEHNKKAKAELVFGKVVIAMDQVVAGIKCYITLVATNGQKKNVYEAQVLEIPWKHYKELLEFKLIATGN